MRFVAYLFKTDGEPFKFKLKDSLHNEHITVYGINPNRPDYKNEFEMHGKRFHDMFIDPSFQTASWFWDYYMPALHSTGTILYHFIETN